MAKRLTDTAKWDKVWFRKLSSTNKNFWIYICDKCDHTGIWEVDFETAAHYIGATLNEKEIKEVFKKQFIELNNGSRWLIKDFIIFQYGNLNEQNKMFFPIKNNLQRYGVSMGDIWGINPLKVKVKVKDKVKDKDKEGLLRGFEDIWKRYPSQVGRKMALKHFQESVITDKDMVDINTALDNYLKSERVLKGYIQNGSTWFNNWRDWIEPQDRLRQKPTQAQINSLASKARFDERMAHAEGE
jgi:hypothetical protein